MLNDFNDGMMAFEFLDITDFGPNKDWILNKDIEDSDESVTEKKANNFVTSMIRRFRANPKLMHLGVFFIAGHGMIHEGSQRILLNEFCKQRKFYKLFAIEISIRRITERFKNSYLIVTMACCREIFNPNTHGKWKCVGARTKAEA